ncbi:radical SAM family heme chaperone HemW [Pararhodobacter sp.]|uniref:radical SAM family heme chaperone HemW n=1 Tax=Pararhodobacter sp. TaxID=2127056 RepID=UPI002AFF5305|nr:radical SAM family heme chaperone HemW [Pararhodobacter sp.]
MKHRNQQATEDWQSGGFGLYVHWPFCASKCPYCDFNSHVSNSIRHSAWRDAYVMEIRRLAAMTQGRILDSIFFGGGTPSTMEPETTAAIIDEARRAWPTRNNLEVTLEANPTSVDLAKFQAFSEAGVNRLSLGIQALNDIDLRMLGRRHSTADAIRAWEVAKTVFERSSFDLIYARQHQTLDQWKTELRQALSLDPTHLSLYQLTIEEGTAFGDRYRLGKLPGLPGGDAGADLYEATQELCAEFALNAYEISNHAKASEESRHNLIYWRYGDYIGVGPGAHGRLTVNQEKLAFEAAKAPQTWLNSVLEGSLSHESREVLSGRDQATEYLMMSLRLREGANIARWMRLGGYDVEPAAMTELTEQGFLWRVENRIGTTESGRQILNALLAALL